MIVLGIESTCDETGCALVREGHEILSNTVSSQIDLHHEYGGVVPELACRRHIDLVVPVLQSCLAEADISLPQIDLISVANGPGLIGALLIGLNFAKGLALALQKPLIGVNHIEAHLYAALMPHLDSIQFPCLGVVLSGGHSALVLIHSVGKYSLIGQTVDDALGEAYDKVAKVLGLAYPGGPKVEALAHNGDPLKFSFKAGRIKDKPYHMSFSGLKTAVLYAVKGVGGTFASQDRISEAEKADVAAAFQETALKGVVSRCMKAVGEFGCHGIVFGGGVTNNRKLRSLVEKSATAPIYWPPAGLELDNAAMIAGLGFHHYRSRGHGDGLNLEALTRIPW